MRFDNNLLGKYLKLVEKQGYEDSWEAFGKWQADQLANQNK